MGEERATVTQPLLVREGHGDGDAGGELQTSSSATVTLVLSTFVAACISFGFGCVMGYSSPTQSVIMEELGLTLAEFSLFGSMLNIGSIPGALASGKTTDLLGRKCTVGFELILHCGMACNSICKGLFCLPFSANFFLYCLIFMLRPNYNVGFSCVGKVPWLLDVGRLLLGFRNGIAGYLGLFRAYCNSHFYSSFLSLQDGWQKLVEKRSLKLLCCPSGERANIFEEANAIKKRNKIKSFSGLYGIPQKFLMGRNAHPLIIGIGLMALQHSGGANAYAYYSGSIFVSAGLSKYIGLSTLAVVEVLCCFKLTLIVKCMSQKLRICIFMYVYR
ncbi:hypothetical protein CRYUN_Cryun05aG0017000 [Craigia yunnanensis]